MNEVNNEIARLKDKISKLLTEYRLKHDELELAVEEWDIAEIHVALEQYNKDIHKLKKKIHDLEVA